MSLRTGVLEKQQQRHGRRKSSAAQRASWRVRAVLEARETRRSAAAIGQVLRGVRIDTEEVTAGLLTHNPFRVETGLRVGALENALVETLEQAAVRAAGRGTAHELARDAVPSLGRIDQISEAVGRWALRHSAERVVAIGADTRAGLRQAIGRGLEQGRHPTAIARELRALVPMDSRQQAAAGRYLDTLLATGAPETRALELVERYSQRAIRQRSLRIARTETIEAFSQGERAVWEEALAEGQVERARLVRVWVASPDACPYCAELDGEELGFDETFSATVELDTGAERTLETLQPPAHVNCLCSVVTQETD